MTNNWSKDECDAFTRYTNNVNVQSQHPLDDKAWRDFVITSHKSKSQLSRNDVETALSNDKRLAPLAGEMADRYEDDRKLLEQYDASGDT